MMKMKKYLQVVRRLVRYLLPLLLYHTVCFIMGTLRLLQMAKIQLMKPKLM